MLAHLLAFDTTHGRWPYSVHYDGDAMEIDGRRVPCYATTDLDQLPWGEHAVDLVLECSGRYKQRAQLQGHLDAGARHVLVSYPVDDADAMVVYGVNHGLLDDSEPIVSNASCTTNRLAPLVAVLARAFTVRQGVLNTLHTYTNAQRRSEKAPAA